MNRFLVPLDGSADAEQILPYVRLLAPLTGARVELLRVISSGEQSQMIAAEAEAPATPTTAEETDWDWEHQAAAQLLQRAHDYLSAHARALSDAGLTVAITADIGSPEEIIVERAEGQPGTLIAMTTHGYSGLRRWALGSVADKVLHATAAPLLLVRGHQPAPAALGRILVPLDGSPLAEQALPVAIDLAAPARAELLLLQAIPPVVEIVPSLTPFGGRSVSSGEQIDLQESQARAQLAALAEPLGARVAVRTLAVLGYAAEVIVDEARRRGADMIVMATHGRSGLSRWMLGSVADKVLHERDIPLLLVRSRAAT